MSSKLMATGMFVTYYICMFNVLTLIVHGFDKQILTLCTKVPFNSIYCFRLKYPSSFTLNIKFKRSQNFWSTINAALISSMLVLLNW